MSASALISGRLFRNPEQRVSKAGNRFVLTTLKVSDGGEATFWSLVAFNETVCAELMRLGVGDALAAQGRLQVETYERDGQSRVSLKMIAENVLALRQPPRAKASKQKSAATPDQQSGTPSREFDDGVPF